MPRLLAAVLAVLLYTISNSSRVHAVPRYHTVHTGETLSAIALRYKVSLAELRQWNTLKKDRIFVGQRLYIQAAPKPTHYTVRPKDSLSQIALRFDLTINKLRQLNALTNDRIYVGQRLKISVAQATTHTVRSGDNLTHIAQRYGLTINKLRQLNNLKSDRIKPGQILRLNPLPDKSLPPTQHPTTQTSPSNYTVRSGDNLTHIAQRYGLTINKLRQLNNLKSDRIKPGQNLVVSSSVPILVSGDIEIEPTEYTVHRGDNLSTIAKQFDLSLGFLRQINALSSDRLQPGQKLRLKTPKAETNIHIVQSGETLSQIAQRYTLNLNELRRLNGIEGSKILKGQKLRLKPTPKATHIVERGDALWEIARAYNMSVDALKMLNQLESDRIYPGQKLKLNVQKSHLIAVYTVKKGDNLSEIARLHQMSVAGLKKLNNLHSSIIHPGTNLKVKPLLAHQNTGSKTLEIDWQSLNLSVAGMRRIISNSGPYYGSRPKANYQKHRNYYEENSTSPLHAYHQARRLWDSFEHQIDAMSPLSNKLQGWHIVLDPGHGGMDPGAIVQTLDSKGNKLYIVEDEYVYDVALRVYVYFRRHGAKVTLTLISPNHIVRSNSPDLTFVNEKNEVYNSYTHNQRNTTREWPRGGRSGNLNNRVRIAQKAFKSVPKGKRIFLSFHADIVPKGPPAPLVLYNANRNGSSVDQASRQFAQALLPALGAGSRSRSQSLGVLRNNPADVKVLIELRNLAYVDHAWALRYEQLRRRDAEKVVKGVLEYAHRQSQRAHR